MGRSALVTGDVHKILTGISKDREGNYKKISADEALNHLKILVKDENSIIYGAKLPGKGAIYKDLGKIREEIAEYQKSDFKLLDSSWSVGSCIEYAIPTDIIPILINRKKELKEVDSNLTIREARWVAKLITALKEPLEREYSHLELQTGALCDIASVYALKEQIANITGSRYPDTDDLDNLFIIKGDVTPQAIFGAMEVFSFDLEINKRKRGKNK